MKASITVLFMASLLLAGLLQAVTMVVETPLRWTEMVVCGDGRYEFESLTQTIMTEDGSDRGERLYVYCVTGTNRADVTTAARWTLFSFWFIVCLTLVGLHMIRVVRRPHSQALSSPTLSFPLMRPHGCRLWPPPITLKR